MPFEGLSNKKGAKPELRLNQVNHFSLSFSWQ